MRVMTTAPRSIPADYPSVTLSSLQAELAAYFSAIAVMLDECYRPGAGDAMLGNAQEFRLGTPFFQKVDVTKTEIGRELPAWFAYAYEGKTPLGMSIKALEAVDGPFPRLVDMLGLLNLEDGYFQDCLDSANADVPIHEAHLKDLVERVQARVELDRGRSLSLRQMAVLANMTERSVKNAITADGAQKLTLNERGEVDAEKAAQWLHSRRGYVKPEEKKSDKAAELPESLSAYELPHFLGSRVYGLSQAEPTRTPIDVAEEAGLFVDRLDEICRPPLSLKPTEIPGLARALSLDELWLTRQVMFALFPEQMALLAEQPGDRRSPGQAQSDSGSKTDQQNQQCIVVLDEAMLRHGYLDIPATEKNLFPAECISASRASEAVAQQVEFAFGAARVLSDIRTKSTRTISPRKRFGAWFNKELQAKPGDRICIERTAERSYALHFLAQ